VLAQASEDRGEIYCRPHFCGCNAGTNSAGDCGAERRCRALRQIAEGLRDIDNPEFQEGALRLLAEFENPALAKRSLDYAVSGKVRNQDVAIQLSIALQTTRRAT
jgi:hypothetical protein